MPQKSEGTQVTADGKLTQRGASLPGYPSEVPWERAGGGGQAAGSVPAPRGFLSFLVQWRQRIKTKASRRRC